MKLKSHYNQIIQEKFTEERITSKIIPIIIEKMKNGLEENQFNSSSSLNIKTSSSSTNNNNSNGICSIDITDYFKKLVLSVISEIFIGIDIVNHPKWNKFAKNLFIVNNSSASTTKGKIKAISQMKQKKAQRNVFKSLEEIIQERLIEISKLKLSASSASIPLDFSSISTGNFISSSLQSSQNQFSSNYPILEGNLLDYLLNASTILDPLHPNEEISTNVSHEIIIHTILSSLSHTHFSIVSILCWLINFIYDSSLGYGELQQLLLLEIDSVSSEYPSIESCSLSEISKLLPLLSSMIKETLRIYAPVSGILRKCKENISIGDYMIPKGFRVIVSIKGTHLHPKYWEEPEKFDPFRFSSKSKKIIEPYSYIPWSGGSHHCKSGLELSLDISRFIIYQLLNQYTLKLSPQSDIKENDHDLFKYPNGLLINYKIRIKSKNKRTLSSSPIQINNQQQQQHTNLVQISPSSSSEQVIPIKQFISSSESEKTWAGLRALIKQKEYPLYVVSGTRDESTGITQTIANWFCLKALEFNFIIDDSPYSPDDILPILQSNDQKNFMIFGFCLASYQGKPANNTKSFYTWIEQMKKSLKQTPLLRTRLRHIYYFVFACGDSSWGSNYQKIPLFIDDALSSLGGNRICTMGEYNLKNDDLHESYSHFYKRLAPLLMHSLPEIGNRKLRDVDTSNLMISNTNSIIEPQMPTSALKMEFVGDLSDYSSRERPPEIITALKDNNQTIYSCRIIKIRNQNQNFIIHNENEQNSIELSQETSSIDNTNEMMIQNELISLPTSSIHQEYDNNNKKNSSYQSIELQIEILPELEYAPGDCLFIYPKISSDIIYKFFSKFTDYDEDMIVIWKSNLPLHKIRKNFHLPINIPLRLGNIFSNLVDLTAKPTRQFLMNISTIVENPSHEVILNSYANDTIKFKKYIKENPTIRLIDIIDSFPIKSSSLDRLIEFLPILKPQAYPICSNWKYHTNYISILITGSMYHHHPVLSYILLLNQQKSLSSIHVSLRTGDPLSLELLKNDECRPLVLLTKGPSIAPFISLLYHALTERIQIRVILLHCLHSSESKKKFILRRSLRRLRSAGILEECHLFYSSQLSFQFNDYEILLWDFINHLQCKTFIAGWNGPLLSEIFDSLVRIIQMNCTPLVYRGDKDYAEAYIMQLQRSSSLEECWY